MARLAQWPGPDEHGVDVFGDPVWQMTLGERAALVGILRTVRPSLAVEIGSMEGGSLVAAAAYADEVHSFDLDPPHVEGADAPNVHLHTGDSHQLLPRVLAEFAAAGRNVDYALVDGDHSTAGVRRDIEDLLGSPAVSRCVIVLHDTANELVRAGCDAVDYDAHPKVRHVDLDLLPGALGRESFPGELWGGLGVIVVDVDEPASGDAPVVTRRHHHGGEMLVLARRALLEGAAPPPPRDVGPVTAGWAAAQRRRIQELEAEVAHHRDLVQALMRSPSWRVTAPLRALKRRLGPRGG